MPKVETFTCGGDRCKSVYTKDEIWFIASDGGNCVITSIFFGNSPGLMIVDSHCQMMVGVQNVEYFCCKRCLKQFIDKKLGEISDNYLSATLGEILSESKPS